MNQNKLTFQSQNLVVDYISFNIPDPDNRKSIAKYLFKKFNFNSTFAKGQNETAESWFYLPRNKHQVSFRQNAYDPESKSFKVGTKVRFSGKNVTQFYSLIQSQPFNWNIFNLYDVNLSRFNLYYLRKSKPTDQNHQLELFME